MKTKPSAIKSLLAAALAASCLASYAAAPQKREMKFEKLRKEFADPPRAFRPAPLWVWNTRVTRADIDRMLGDFKAQGFGGAFVHPRPGLVTEYLSDEWFDLYKYSVEKGKELGLDIWIYDENSYPSGFAGGHVPAQMPESYDQGQGLALTKTALPPADAGKYFLCLKKEGGTFRDITADTGRYKDVPGEYYLYEKTYYGRSGWHGGYSYVDLLVEGVTEKFLDITMSGYEKTFGNELGPVIRGLFSDEPCIPSSGGVRWTPDLFEVFRKQWGYDLATSLPLLSEQTGDWKQVRHNYLETLTQMFVDRWAKPMSAYCDRKGMLWTGHYWEHDWPSMYQGGDNMAMYAWHQMPAIDMLFNQYNDQSPQAQFGNVRAVKELRSAANQTGCVRTLSETYGGGGWDETFRDFKRLGDWEYALGVNFMNQHLSHMTIAGARKYDYPPVFTRLSPWWEDYKVLNDYFARLSLVLSQGEQMNDILVLEPTTTIWLYYSYVMNDPRCMEIGSAFQRFVTTLEKAQAEYDLGSEHIIKDRGSVRGGKFVVGKRAYAKVVIPPMTENLNAGTFSLIRQFVEAGGQLVLFAKPTLVDGRPSPELADFLDRNASRIRRYTALDGKAIAESFADDRIRFCNVRGNDLYHQRRSYEDGELLFLVNSSLSDTATGSVGLPAGELVELDAVTGDMRPYPHTADGKSVGADFSLPPAGSLLLFAPASGRSALARTSRATSGTERPTAESVKLEPAGPLEVTRLKDNVLNLDFCDLTVDGRTERNLYTFEACNKLFNHCYGTGNPWDSAIQYRQTIVERDTLTTGDIRVSYHFVVAGDFDTRGMKLVAEQPGIWNVKFNGTPVEAAAPDTLLDSRFGIYPVGNLVRRGTNTVELSVSPMSIYAEIAPVYLFGDFALESAGAGWIVREPAGKPALGSWKRQGLPFYSWDMAYGRDYDIDDPAAGYTLRLRAWEGTLARVCVNGRKAGIIAWQPYAFDLTPYLRKGRNRVEVHVVGSLKNLFGPHYSADKGIAGPWHWNNVPKQLPGSDYDQRDYGLLEDFEIVMTK